MCSYDVPIPCWGDPNLPDNLDDNDLEKYTKDLADFGPHDKTQIGNRNTIRDKWKRRAPGPNRYVSAATWLSFLNQLPIIGDPSPVTRHRWQTLLMIMNATLVIFYKKFGFWVEARTS